MGCTQLYRRPGVLSGLVADFHAAQPCGSEAWEHWDWKAINIEKVSGLCAEDSLGVEGAAVEEKLLACGCNSGPTFKEQTEQERLFFWDSCHETKDDFKEWQYIVGSINYVWHPEKWIQFSFKVDFQGFWCKCLCSGPCRRSFAGFWSITIYSLFPWIMNFLKSMGIWYSSIQSTKYVWCCQH